MDKVDRPTTRRALLVAAAGGAAALAAQAVAPLAASAHDPEDVKLADANSATAPTEIHRTDAGNVFEANTAATATGFAVLAKSAVEAGIYAVSGDAALAAPHDKTVGTGVYGYTPTSAHPDTYTGTGVWGDSDDVGVIGTGGSQGVLGDGYVGVEGDTSDSGGVGVLGFAGSAGSVGVYAQADATDRIGLKVKGKVAFSRSGKTTIGAGASSKAISVGGVTTGSLVFAVLSTNRAGRWVRAVAPAAGKFTVYLNASVPAATSVVWWIIN